jgi:hypothetical protein
MILLLSRGSYCPKDHQQHLELAVNYPKIAVAYTQIVTISTDNQSSARAIQSRKKILVRAMRSLRPRCRVQRVDKRRKS